MTLTENKLLKKLNGFNRIRVLTSSCPFSTYAFTYVIVLMSVF